MENPHGVDKMPELEQLQRAFAHYLLREQGDITLQVAGDDKASAEERMALYAGAYRARLIETLGNDFPGLWGLLGDRQFWSLCLDYIDHFPSRYPSIRWFGVNMEQFLRTYEPYSEYPQVAEMAAFEWAQNQVFDAKDSSVLTVQDVQNIPAQHWPGMSFTFIPAMQTLDLFWNAPSIWKALDEAGDSVPDWERRSYPQVWLVWRQMLTPKWRPLPVDEAWALEQARQGADFASLCEGLLEWVDAEHAPARAARFLRNWVEQGLLSGTQIRE